MKQQHRCFQNHYFVWDWDNQQCKYRLPKSRLNEKRNKDYSLRFLKLKPTRHYLHGTDPEICNLLLMDLFCASEHPLHKAFHSWAQFVQTQSWEPSLWKGMSLSFLEI